MRIVFMGTPEFAVASLRRLAEDGHDIAGVFTQPDKPGNRNKLTAPPVKEYAMSMKLPVFQPERLKGEEAVSLLRSLRPELTVVAAYGQILPEDVLSVPALGSINVHASLLPRYRGAAPINWVILNGETVTGVTIMHMAKKLDAGDIISTRKTEIAPEEDAQALYSRLARMGAELLSETIPAVESGAALRIPQDDAQSTYAPMLSRELSPVDWSKPAGAVVNQVRGLVPWPCAAMLLDGKSVKLWRAEAGCATDDPAGMARAGRRGIVVSCGDGRSVIITELQPAGGKRMAASAWLNGKRVAPGAILS